jgi:hypothetical protein
MDNYKIITNSRTPKCMKCGGIVTLEEIIDTAIKINNCTRNKYIKTKSIEFKSFVKNNNYANSYNDYIGSNVKLYRNLTALKISKDCEKSISFLNVLVCEGCYTEYYVGKYKDKYEIFGDD